MTRTQTKGCGCGGSRGYVLELDQPISKSILSVFKQSGYKILETHVKVGVFFVEKGGLTASAPFGGKKIQVRCSGSVNCSLLTDHLENTFKVALLQEPM